MRPAGLADAAQPAVEPARQSTEVVTIGECLVSLVAEVPGPLMAADRLRRFVAGAEANVAVGLARLGHRAVYVGRVGADGFGEAIRQHLRGEGVDVAALASDPEAATGVMVRELRGLGASEVLYLRRDSAGSRLAPADVRAAEAAFATARWLHVTGITPALSASAAEAVEASMARARAGGMTISLDLNLRRRLWSDETAAPVLRRLAGLADIVLGDLDEAAVVTQSVPDVSAEAAAEALRRLGPATAVVTLGAAGAFAIGADGQAFSRPGLLVTTVVDPVGAGDAFAAGYIAARLEGLDEPTALDWANACGASVVAVVGDMTGLPTRTELERLLTARRAATSRDTLR